MEIIPFIILFLYSIASIGCLVLLIYLIFKRKDKKANETFEQRDN